MTGSNCSRSYFKVGRPDRGRKCSAELWICRSRNGVFGYILWQKVEAKIILLKSDGPWLPDFQFRR